MDIVCCYWLGIIGEQNSWIHFLDIDSIKNGIFLTVLLQIMVIYIFLLKFRQSQTGFVKSVELRHLWKMFLTLRVYSKYLWFKQQIKTLLPWTKHNHVLRRLKSSKNNTFIFFYNLKTDKQIQIIITTEYNSSYLESDCPDVASLVFWLSNRSVNKALYYVHVHTFHCSSIVILDAFRNVIKPTGRL